MAMLLKIHDPYFINITLHVCIIIKFSVIFFPFVSCRSFSFSFQHIFKVIHFSFFFMLAFDEMHRKNTRASIKYRQKITKKTENNVVNASERREYVYGCTHAVYYCHRWCFFQKNFFWLYQRGFMCYVEPACQCCKMENTHKKLMRELKLPMENSV